MDVVTAAAILITLSGVSRRAPTQKELRSGVPADFTVEERPRKSNPRNIDKYYYSTSGKKYRSILEIKRNILT
tara:strand:+ start:185 stop:403 length:219 start_codon:yes stop_codon:yes gene_type:complete